MSKKKILIPSIIEEENSRPDCCFSDVCCACFNGCDNQNTAVEQCIKYISWKPEGDELEI